MKSSPLSVFQVGINRQQDPCSSHIISEWQCPSNIALVKYWGKKEGQIPANPSLSLTLTKAVTRTSVIAFKAEKGKNFLMVNGDSKHPFTFKLQKLINILTSEISILQDYSFQVNTTNTFPHSAGIASSASGISAFTLCLLTIISKITGKVVPEKEFLQMASYVSRMGSGSACRSVYGGYSLWGETPGIPGSSDLFAIPVNDTVQADFLKLHNAILVVSSSPKSLSSSVGHELMKTHPFATLRVDQALTNIQDCLNAIRSGDFDKLGNIAENEALTLHSLIMTSEGGTILMEPSSLLIIKKVQQARKHGFPVFFSLDAGPNVHVLYPDTVRESVEKFIREDLAPLCENGHVIFDQCGTGPVFINKEQDFSI